MNIKACITDRFRKTYRSLKKNEQELVDKGIDLWLQNPDNSSSNFEKLSFMGDNIFSIRLTSSWRVIMAKFDDVYFLLHTGGQHDKTNEWDATYRWYTTTLGISFEHPMDRAFDNKLIQTGASKTNLFV